MSVDLFKRVIAEMTANGIRNLEFSSAQGEPLLSPHAGECVRLAIDAGLNVHLNRRAIVAGSVRRVHSADHRVSTAVALPCL